MSENKKQDDMGQIASKRRKLDGKFKLDPTLLFIRLSFTCD